MVLTRLFLENMRQKRWAEGLEQGLEQGTLQGATRQQKRWEDWNYRRLQAREEGSEFNEPPPRLDDKG